MKKDLIEKLLNEQITPEEEHLVAKMLQQEEDIEQWLTEDETAEYDRIVSQRIAKQKAKEVIEPDIHEAVPSVHNAEPFVAVVASSKPLGSTHKRVKQQKKTSTTDSLQYYIARLEKELENVNESTYTSKAEEVLRADARLQKLVQRIMTGELTKDNVPAEALNTNKTMEEQP